MVPTIYPPHNFADFGFLPGVLGGHPMTRIAIPEQGQLVHTRSCPSLLPFQTRAWPISGQDQRRFEPFDDCVFENSSWPLGPWLASHPFPPKSVSIDSLTSPPHLFLSLTPVAFKNRRFGERPKKLPQNEPCQNSPSTGQTILGVKNPSPEAIRPRSNSLPFPIARAQGKKRVPGMLCLIRLVPSLSVS